MPCQSDYYISPSDIDALTRGDRKKLDNVTRMLCALCEVIEKHHPDSAIQKSTGAITGLHTWWTNHKRMDEAEQRRKAEASAKKAAAEIRRQVSGASDSQTYARRTRGVEAIMNQYIGQSISIPLVEHGGSMVVVNNAGESISNAQLDEQMRELLATKGIDGLSVLKDCAPVIMFVRDDGWVLASSLKFERVAYNMWKDEWIGFVKCPDDIIEDIADYTPGLQDF